MNQIKINTQQKQAVTHSKGPLLIIAGAGSGKTTVVTERIKYLIHKKNIDPLHIFAATFTDKSATEMLDRLDVVMPLGYEEPWLGTFHSLCDRILRAEALEIGLDPSYKIITPVDQWIMLKKHLFEFKLNYYRPLGNPTKFISALLKFFSRAKDEDTTTEELTKYATKKMKKAKTQEEQEQAQRVLELAKAFDTYEKLKIKDSFLDFGDLITKTLLLFRQRKSILKKYQNQFSHILVDEFQDTNYAQYQLIKLLAPASQNPNLIVVGDDDQSIYKFRGAAVSNILEFKKDYPKAKEVVLTTNYRSTKSLLTSAYKLIQNNNPDRLENKLNINKNLKPVRQEKFNTPQIIAATSETNEVDAVVGKILKLLAKHNYSYKDFAILARANAHLDPFVAGFRRAGMPYQLIGNRGLFNQEEVRELLHVLRVIANPEETSSLFHFLHLSVLGLSADFLLELLNKARSLQSPLWEILKNEDDQRIKDIITMIQKFQDQALSEPVSKLLYTFIFKTGYILTFTEQETIENQLKIKNINLLFEKIKRSETTTKQSTITDFIETLELWEEAGENPAQAVIEDIDTINLLTIHAAKGLEFPVVFVPSLIVGRFPSINRRDPIAFPEELIKEELPQGSEFTQEERRLFYVAMTRARDYLFFSYAKDYGGVRERKPSGFLKETGIKEKKAQQTSSQLSLLEKGFSSPTVRYLDKKGEIEIKRLSYSQIDTFLACPLKYKYRYLLRVPAEPHHALSFGETIHNTLHEFHRHEQQGTIPDLKTFLTIYKKNFIELGYESESHKQERFKAGNKALTTYHQEFKSVLGKPKLLEKRFQLNIAGVQFVGKIDRIDETDDELEIVDYKTGAPSDQKSVDKDKQLSIYGLAAKEAFGININKMSLYFIEENLKITTSRDEKDLKREEEYLIKMTQKMKDSQFPAKPGYPFPCNFCEYNRICPFAAKPK